MIKRFAKSFYRISKQGDFSDRPVDKTICKIVLPDFKE